MKEIEKLKKMGLYVEEYGEVGPYAIGYYIGRIKNNLDKKLGFTVINNDGEKFELIESIHLYPDNGLWILEVWECAPGPSEDDFVCKFVSLDNAVDAAINFFFDKPVIINGWVFPLHRHPEMQADLIDAAVNNAVKINASDFDKIENEYLKIYWQGPGWENALRCFFLKISPLGESEFALMIRRDLKESYLVSNK